MSRLLYAYFLAICLVCVAQTQTNEVTDLSLDDLLSLEVVSATRASVTLRESPVPVSVLTAAEIAQSGAQDIPELLSSLAAVDILALGASQTEVSIRGKGVTFNRRLLVLIDGHSEYIDVFGVTLWHALPVTLDDIERIEVIRGPASSVYGANAFAGVVNIITKKAKAPGAEVRLSSGNNTQLAGHLRAHWLNDNMSLIVSGGAENVDSLETRVEYPGFNRIPTSYNFVDDEQSKEVNRITVSLEVHKTNALTFSAQTGVTDGTLELFPQPGLPREDWDITRRFLKAGLDFSMRPGHELSVQFHLSQFKYRTPLVPSTADVLSAVDPGNRFYPSLDDAVPFEGNSDIGSLTLVWTGLNQSTSVNWVAGLEYRKIDNKGGLVLDSDKEITSIFANSTWKANQALSLSAGLRVDDDSITQQDFGYNASLIWLANPDTDLRMTARRAFRAPSLFELFSEIDLNVPRQNHRVRFRGNPSLENETINTVDLTFVRRFGARSQIEAEYYYETYSELIGNPDSGRLTDIEFDPTNNLFTTTTSFENLSNAYSRGLQISWRFFVGAGHQIHANVHGMSPSGLNDLSGETFFTPRFKSNAGWTWQHISGFQSHLEFHYTDRTDPNEFTSGDIASEGPNFTRDNQQDYTTFSLRLAKSLDIKQGLDVFVHVRNLFDERYVAYYEFDSVLSAAGEEQGREIVGGLIWRF